MAYGPGYKILLEADETEDERCERMRAQRERGRSARELLEQQEIARDWATGQGVFRRELGPTRRGERVTAREEAREQRRVAARDVEDRAWQTARDDRSPSPSGINEVDTRRACVGGRLDVYHRM